MQIATIVILSVLVTSGAKKSLRNDVLKNKTSYHIPDKRRSEIIKMIKERDEMKFDIRIVHVKNSEDQVKKDLRDLDKSVDVTKGETTKLKQVTPPEHASKCSCENVGDGKCSSRNRNIVYLHASEFTEGLLPIESSHVSGRQPKWPTRKPAPKDPRRNLFHTDNPDWFDL